MSTKRKISTKLGQPAVKPSAKIFSKVHINEASAVVTGRGGTEEEEKEGENREHINGGSGKVVEISSDESSDSEFDSDGSDDDVDTTQPTTTPKDTPTTQKAEEITDGGVQISQMSQSVEQRQENDEGEEPSFGDILLTTHVDVTTFNPTIESDSGPLIPAPSNALSLTTVLSQALRTNDVNLLESCLHTTDAPTIRSTIQRLSSPLASTLLSKLAERLHRRPGRSGSLMIWVQWTLVTHGGYLATQKDLVKQLRELNKVLEERSRSLNSLLSLKGKLDMLEAQMQLRKAMRNEREADEDEADEAVIYVENSDSEEDAEEEEEVDSETELTSQNKAARTAVNGLSEYGGSVSSGISEDMPNGIGAEMDDDNSDDNDMSDLIDDEAEETDEGSEDDEEEVDYNEVDEDEDEESEEEQVRPKKIIKTGGMFQRVGR